VIAAVPTQKIWLVINNIQMKNPNRELVLLLKAGKMNQLAIEKELVYLDELLRNIESPANFCITHELVSRNRITNNKAKLIKSFHEQELKPFRFLICKN
jgi:hypothetical protein